MDQRTHGFRFPLTLTVEMKRALTRICADQEAAYDFPVGLRIFRAGQLLYGGLTADDVQSMYQRRTGRGHRLVTDAEVDFLVEHQLIPDFRTQTPEALAEQRQRDEERRILAKQFLDAEECLDGMMVKSKLHWIREADKHSEMPEAQRFLRAVRAESRSPTE